MKNLLFIKSSILNQSSVSNKYAEKLIEKLNPENVVVRDLDKNEVTLLDMQVLSERNSKNGPSYIEHIELINEIKNADTVVIAAPMYNFNIPVQLHKYFDALAIAGETFHYEKDGTQIGHLKNKSVYVVISRGGMYKENNITHQEDYIKLFFNFLGVNDVKFIFIEGVAVGKTTEDLDEQFKKQI